MQQQVAFFFFRGEGVSFTGLERGLKMRIFGVEKRHSEKVLSSI